MKSIELMNYLSEQDRQHLMMRPTECFDQGLSIRNKIKLAQNLYVSWQNALQKQFHINNLLADLERCIKSSSESMMDFRIIEICKGCDEKEGAVAAEPGWRTSSTLTFCW